MADSCIARRSRRDPAPTLGGRHPALAIAAAVALGAGAVAAAEPQAAGEAPRVRHRTSQAAVPAYTYRFIVPVELHKIPTGVTSAAVECEICQQVSPSGHSCGSPRVVASAPISLRGGEATGEVEVDLREHLMVQTGMYEMSPTAKDLKYFCFLELNGQRLVDHRNGEPLPGWAAEGTQPVVRVPQGHPGQVPE